MTIRRSEPFLFLLNGTGAYITNLYIPSRKTKKVFGESLYTALLQGSTVGAAYWRAELDMMKDPELSGECSWAPFCYWGK